MTSEEAAEAEQFAIENNTCIETTETSASETAYFHKK